MAYPKLTNRHARARISRFARASRVAGGSHDDTREVIAGYLAYYAGLYRRRPDLAHAVPATVDTEQTARYRAALAHGLTSPERHVDPTPVGPSSFLATQFGNLDASTWAPRLWCRRTGIKAVHAIIRKTRWTPRDW